MKVRQSFERLAAHMVAQKVDLVVDNKDENLLADAMKGTNAVRNKTGEGKYRAITFRCQDLWRS